MAIPPVERHPGGGFNPPVPTTKGGPDYGRKIFVAGRVTDGDVLLADGEALFVRLRPGQP